MDAEDGFDWEGESRGCRIEVLESGGEVCVLVEGQLYMRWEEGDEESRRMAMVQLHACGRATRDELASAFGVHANTLQKYITQYAQDGSGGLTSRQRGPQGGWRLTPQRRGKILTTAIRGGVESVDALQRRLHEQWGEEISRRSIRRVLEENGLLDAERPEAEGWVEQGELFTFPADRQLDLALGVGDEAYGWFSEGERQSEPEAAAVDGGVDAVDFPRKRSRYSSAQRVYFDRLAQGDYNAYAGGLLFASFVQRYEFASTLERVFEISTHEGYSLNELCLTLLYADVFGFRSMEDFKRAYPEEFGVLIGRTQSPSVFTLRRFLHAVRELGKSEALIDEFAVSYLKHGQAQWGVMYIDGHFLPYHGVYPITKGWHGVRQMAMKGSYNFLAVDEHFRPWVFLVRSSSEDLLKKIPELIEKAKKLGRAAGLSQDAVEDLIVLFDREGYSAELYRYLEGKGEDPKRRRAIFISWAKYADKWVYDIPEEALDKTVEVRFQVREPETMRYVEMHRTMNKYGKIRAVVIQSGKQRRRAAIYTNAHADELDAQRVVQLMCRRWGEENQIKELLLKHMINYMPGYVVEDLEEQPWVENPKIKELKKKRAGLQNNLRGFKIQLAEEMLKHTDGRARPVNAKEFPVMENIVRIDNEILLLNTQLDDLPSRVRFDEAHDGEKLMALNYEKKRFLDCIKVFSANLTEAMCGMLLKYYDRRKEILPAWSMIVQRAGEVRLEGGQLKVRLRRFRNPEIDYAARRLCEDLNRMGPATLDRFRIPLHYEVA